MNKKKIAALALLGTLLLGGAGFGAYSWFTDNAQVSSNLTISTGTLKVVSDDSTASWKYLGQNGDQIVSNLKTPTTEFTNAQPGDNFCKIVTIKNDGTLSEKLHFTVHDKIAEKYGYSMYVTAGDDSGNPHNAIQDTVLKSGDTLDLRIVLTLDGEHMGNDFNGKDLGKNMNLEEIIGNKNVVTVDATQINATSTTTNNTVAK